ncbi:hypothetical protein PNA2_1244 [Pyrococcus sp. NA2]|uniref:DUF523 domain-containing protein n=1 Tax=Pyrococcus sp. (strain NA2) TaxID=342949 RepID=UPI000209ACBB|nr:DUF523 domain-containing protein [Pyrococcus sp. NA2]AEC52159.1 hypothetical protein PNA2_1244 [Pyrococcus sp. NA2]
MKLIVIAPCLISPFYVYRGPKEKEYVTAKEIRKLIGELGEDWQILTYPCPEFELLKWPRPPMSKEVFERLGMKKIASDIADYIGRVIVEEKPEVIIFVGVKGSPTCGVYTTTSSDPGRYPLEEIRRFFYMSKEERLARYKEIIEKGLLKIKSGRGILFEELFNRFNEANRTFWVEIDKDSITNGIKNLRTIIKEIEKKAKD